MERQTDGQHFNNQGLRTDLVLPDDISQDQRRPIEEIVEKARITLFPAMVASNLKEDSHHCGRVVLLGSLDGLYDFTIKHVRELITQTDFQILDYFDPNWAIGTGSSLRRALLYMAGEREGVLVAEAMDQVLRTAEIPEELKITNFYYGDCPSAPKTEPRYRFFTWGGYPGIDKKTIAENAKDSLRWCGRWEDEDETHARLSFISELEEDEFKFIQQIQKGMSLYFALISTNKTDASQPTGLERRILDLNTSEDKTRLEHLFNQIVGRCSTGFASPDEVKAVKDSLVALFKRKKDDFGVSREVIYALGKLRAKEGIGSVFEFATYIPDKETGKEEDLAIRGTRYSWAFEALRKIGGQKAIRALLGLLEQADDFAWKTWCARETYDSLVFLKGWIKQDRLSDYQKSRHSYLVDIDGVDDTFDPELANKALEKFKEALETAGKDSPDYYIEDLKGYISDLNNFLLSGQVPEGYVLVK